MVKKRNGGNGEASSVQRASKDRRQRGLHPRFPHSAEVNALCAFSRFFFLGLKTCHVSVVEFTANNHSLHFCVRALNVEEPNLYRNPAKPLVTVVSAERVVKRVELA